MNLGLERSACYAIRINLRKVHRLLLEPVARGSTVWKTMAN
jgi:hypothetical protein